MSKLKELFEQRPIDVIQEISPNDQMYQGNKEHYFHVGQSALKCIKLAMLTASKDLSDIKNVLDMPCGHGRVLRILKAVFPGAEITACDLDRTAVDFCSSVFSAKPVYSNKQLVNIQIKDRFDLIWCGSLLTHLNSDKWSDFLKYFDTILQPSGILIFTTHGHFAANNLRSGKFKYGLEDHVKIKSMINNYDNKGFGYINYENTNDYGISLSSPSYVLTQLKNILDLRILTFTEQGWDNHQDVIACIKTI